MVLFLHLSPEGKNIYSYNLFPGLHDINVWGVMGFFGWLTMF